MESSSEPQPVNFLSSDSSSDSSSDESDSHVYRRIKVPDMGGEGIGEGSSNVSGESIGGAKWIPEQRQTTRWTKKQKRMIVAECVDDKMSPVYLARKWGCSAASIRQWVRGAGKELPEKYEQVQTKNKVDDVMIEGAEITESAMLPTSPNVMEAVTKQFLHDNQEPSHDDQDLDIRNSSNPVESDITCWLCPLCNMLYKRRYHFDHHLQSVHQLLPEEVSSIWQTSLTRAP